MVDVTGKPATQRTAVARATVSMQPATRRHIEASLLPKGDVKAIAEIAGIMGAKQTSALIPLCHPLPLTHVSVACEWTSAEDAPMALLTITSTIHVKGQTGVEMEALTACAVASLTVYDMCKAIDKQMIIQDIRLIQKMGGKSRTYEAAE